MFVAYAIPIEDHHLLVEDGLGLLAVAATREIAEANVREQFEKEQDEMVALSKKYGYPDDKLQFDDCYVLHCNEV